jgi:hypothetical protein
MLSFVIKSGICQSMERKKKSRAKASKTERKSQGEGEERIILVNLRSSSRITKPNFILQFHCLVIVDILLYAERGKDM